MENDHVLSGLLRKRATIAGQIEGTQTQLRQLVIDLDSLDSIRLFAPDIDLAEIKPKPLPPKHHAFKGEVTRIVLETLRRAGRPMTSQELAQHVMAGWGLNTADKGLMKLMGKRVGACLRHWRARGMVKAGKGQGSFLAWEIAR